MIWCRTRRKCYYWIVAICLFVILTNVFTYFGSQEENINLLDPVNAKNEPSLSVSPTPGNGRLNKNLEFSNQRESKPDIYIVKRSPLVSNISKSSNILKQKSESYLINSDDGSHIEKNSIPTELDDVYLSVKTTKAYHKERLDLLLDTWWVFAQGQTYFFTDGEDEEYQQKTNGHLVNTNCANSHNRKALCCKMSVEYDYFIESNKRWFCHLDDDTYVNIPELVKLLQSYNHTEDWYLGRPSLQRPIQLQVPNQNGAKIAFWFATGGAGICISRGLALKMMPHAGGGKLKSTCEKIRLPDDCTLGYIIGYLLNKQLTVIDKFHSHLEGLWLINEKRLPNQITFSYKKHAGKLNIINISGYDDKFDPTRLHLALLTPQKLVGMLSRLMVLILRMTRLDLNQLTASCIRIWRRARRCLQVQSRLLIL